MLGSAAVDETNGLAVKRLRDRDRVLDLVCIASTGVVQKSTEYGLQSLSEGLVIGSVTSDCAN